MKEMRRKDRKLARKETITILKNGEYGVLSSINEDGSPYGVPLNYVYADHSIYFHCAPEGQKLDNIRHRDQVSFCVVGNTGILPAQFTTNYESAVIFGRASEVNDEEKTRALMEMIYKYSPDDIEKGKAYIKKAAKATRVIKINIEHLSGKSRR